MSGEKRKVEGLKLDDGSTYTGEVNEPGEPDGQGVMTWPDGKRYEGEFREGEPIGEHVLTEPDGARFKAVWRDGDWHKGEPLPGRRKAGGDYREVQEAAG